MKDKIIAKLQAENINPQDYNKSVNALNMCVLSNRLIRGYELYVYVTPTLTNKQLNLCGIA